MHQQPRQPTTDDRQPTTDNRRPTMTTIQHRSILLSISIALVLLCFVHDTDGFARPKSFRQGGRRLLQGVPPEQVLALIDEGTAANVTEAVTLIRAWQRQSRKPQRGRRRKVGYELLRDGATLTDVAKVSSSQKNSYNFFNFYKRTGAEYEVCEAPERAADYRSASGSIYWDEGDYVIRQADHWTGSFGVYKLKDCMWTINATQTSKKEVLTGKCADESFLSLKPPKNKKKKKKKGGK